MNPTNSEVSGNKMPPPMMEQAPASQNQETGAGLGQEQLPAAPEFGRNPVAPSGAQPQVANPIPLPITPMPVPTQQQVPAQSNPAPTSTLNAKQDTDLIEKEWVNKAKIIVERTRDDPYKQSEQLTGVKVDYMKKRYNKSIKLNK